MLITLFFSLVSATSASASSSLVCRNAANTVVWMADGGNIHLYLGGKPADGHAEIGEETDLETKEETRSCSWASSQGRHLEMRHFNTLLTLPNGEKEKVACEAIETYTAPCGNDFFGGGLE